MTAGAKECVRTFISEEFDVDLGKIKDDDSLLDSGILDSLGVVKLMAFIEERFKIVVGPAEVTMDNFDTIEKILKYVAAKSERPPDE